MMNVKILVRSDLGSSPFCKNLEYSFARHRGPGSPIARLSEDVLYEIFCLLAAFQDADDPRPFSYTALKQRNSWLAITYVCRYWRHIALHSPRLWTLLVLNEDCNLTWIRECLIRSQSSKLVINMEGPATSPEAVADMRYMASMVALRTRRIASLFVINFSPEDTNFIVAPFRQPAPLLVTLIVSADQMRFPSTSSLIPMFSGKMPKLTSVVICPMSMPWCPYENLTQILLPNQPVPSLTELMWTIRRCPRLESLGLGLLGHSYPPDPPALTQDLILDSPVELPLLSNLLLFGHYDIVTPLLGRIIYPPTATTVLSFKHQPFNRCRFLSAPSCASAGGQVQSLTMDMYLWKHGCGLRLASLQPDTFTAQWEWTDRTDAFHDPQRLAHFGETVHFAGAQQLAIQALDVALYEQDWLHVLAQMPALRRIELVTCFAGPPTLLGALARTRACGAEGRVPAVCPLLEEFVVPGEHYWSEETVESIIALCEARAALGVGLKTMELRLSRPREAYSDGLDKKGHGLVSIIWPRVRDDREDRNEDEETDVDDSDDEES
ncbi:hypothetical protein WOLCODRAFT_108528 [Wolfiporia cocos MD-104 SS10]|uniref:Uncharacterized protein n=1 Tax=Wolfiporia cocos (strain MD-104) TaxID=742152 RepID=A0A2H3J2V5_WOLCO|nr:hypothetical protein WOLCODRAFT_108528 [Wolfiporia cocos MD-104 SS10]